METFQQSYKFLSDDFKVHYCTILPGGEMVKLVFEVVLGSFSGGGEKHTFHSKSLINFLLKRRHHLDFLDTAYRLCASV